MTKAKLFIVIQFLLATFALAQEKTFEPIAKFPLAESPLKITQLAVPKRPFTVAGERGAVLGQQDGSFELWSFPYKLLQHARLFAEIDGYGVPIDLNQQASTIEVSPDHTTITYAHHAITVKQEMFSVRGATDDEPGALVLFSIDATGPTTVTLQFEPVMAPMWPAPQYGEPGASWVPIGSGGGFIIASDNPRQYGIVAMPQASSGVLAPYQERPKAHPLEFKIRFDPKRDRDRYFPLIALLGDSKQKIGAAAQASLVQNVIATAQRVPALYEQTRLYYAKFFDNRLTIDSPDASLNLATRWAELAIDQSQVRFHDETGLTAGWFTSADSLRPGYGWFFGRDTLWTLYAIHSYGDFDLARRALNFLIKRQRPDGKIMHEFSQSADLVDWQSFPYMYAAADSTPLFVMLMEDYVRSTGDVQYLQSHWDNVTRAYQFTRQHDSDGDGIYDNSQGTGWVESWPPGGPNQELYLASLDQQSAEAYSRLASLTSHESEVQAARKVADAIRPKLAEYRGNDGLYAFSRNRDGSYDRTPTIFPSVAWWTGRLSLPNADSTLNRWASHEFFTDWGARAVSAESPVYDAISYHQGSVWPLFTGWSSLAQYRADRALSGYAQMMANLKLTFLQDLGGVTELLSGDYYEPLGRSSSHQMWSSAMVLSPALRGLIGLEVDVLHHRVRLNPKLPATWDTVSLQNVPYGNGKLAMTMSRRNGELEVAFKSPEPQILCVDSQPTFDDSDCKGAPSATHVAHIKLPPVEVGIPDEETLPGNRTHQLKVIGETHGDRELKLNLESPAGTLKLLPIRFNLPRPKTLKVEGASIDGNKLAVQFPKGTGYTNQQVTIHW